jgi:RNA polymerase nonessential primary-like sigma factor
MPATSFYADAAYEAQQSNEVFDPELAVDVDVEVEVDTEVDIDIEIEADVDVEPEESDLTSEDLEELEMVSQDPASFAVAPNRRSTDLVRLYLQEIGRVRLLGRDEEVSEAQKVQRYLR